MYVYVYIYTHTYGERHAQKHIQYLHDIIAYKMQQ